MMSITYKILNAFSSHIEKNKKAGNINFNKLFNHNIFMYYHLSI